MTQHQGVTFGKNQRNLKVIKGKMKTPVETSFRCCSLKPSKMNGLADTFLSATPENLLLSITLLGSTCSSSWSIAGTVKIQRFQVNYMTN